MCAGGWRGSCRKRWQGTLVWPAHLGRYRAKVLRPKKIGWGSSITSNHSRHDQVEDDNALDLRKKAWLMTCIMTFNLHISITFAVLRRALQNSTKQTRRLRSYMSSPLVTRTNLLHDLQHVVLLLKIFSGVVTTDDEPNLQAHEDDAGVLAVRQACPSETPAFI